MALSEAEGSLASARSVSHSASDSSSSSSSDSDDASVGNEGGAAAEAADSDAAEAADSDTDAAAAVAPAVPRPRERRGHEAVEAAAGDGDEPPVVRRRLHRDETFEWRGFRFTYRPPTRTKANPSFMVLCRYHSRAYVETKCTRSATWTREEDKEAAIRKLKTWCFRAPSFDYTGSPPDRMLHQRHDKAGTEVLTDAALDEAPLPGLPDPNS